MIIETVDRSNIKDLTDLAVKLWPIIHGIP
jgi:hypothetical protein